MDNADSYAVTLPCEHDYYPSRGKSILYFPNDAASSGISGGAWGSCTSPCKKGSNTVPDGNDLQESAHRCGYKQKTVHPARGEVQQLPE